MQALELSKQLFRNTEVRIFGTPDAPLFVANDIGALLGIKNVKDAVSKFEDYKKLGVDIADPHGRLQTTTVLTEAGLYSLILKSKKPVAREFEKWVLTEVLPTIRRTGNFNLQGNIEKQQLEAQLEESQAEVSRLRLGYKPTVTYHEVDINEFMDKPCVYLYHLKDNDYKFGVSGEIVDRQDAHEYKFGKKGCVVKLVKLWNCATMKIMKDTEKKIKLFAVQNNISVNKYNQKEIIETDDIDVVVAKIDKYVAEQNATDVTVMRIREKEIDLEMKRTEVKSKKQDVETERLRLENKRLDFEIMKFKASSMSVVECTVPISFVQTDNIADPTDDYDDTPTDKEDTEYDDPLDKFIAETTYSTARQSVTRIYEDYCTHCNANEVKSMSSNTLMKYLVSKGFITPESSRDSKRVGKTIVKTTYRVISPEYIRADGQN